MFWFCAVETTAQAPGCLNASSYNTPCTACLYDFQGGDMNIVPCGPSANTTSSVPINHGNGNGDPGYTGGPSCGTVSGDVLWVSFLIQEGGSFEWQTVAGPDDFYWDMYYSTQQSPDDGSSGNPNTADCAGSNLVHVDCGTEFTGWRVESTPDPTKRWRFYIAYYFRNGDTSGTGVVKIRKSCGLSCEGNDIAVVASDDVCITGSPGATLTATASGGGGGPYSYSWLPTDGLSNPSSSTTNATPSMTTTYTVTAVGADGCPAVDFVTVEVGSCCNADGGMLSGDITQDEDLCLGTTDLDASIFSTDAVQPAGYSYAFFIVDANGNIIEVSAGMNTSFDFSTLSSGMYNIYGISYLDAEGAGSAFNYANGFATLTALQTDIINGTCAAVAMFPYKVTIEGVAIDCTAFPGQ